MARSQPNQNQKQATPNLPGPSKAPSYFPRKNHSHSQEFAPPLTAKADISLDIYVQRSASFDRILALAVPVEARYIETQGRRGAGSVSTIAAKGPVRILVSARRLGELSRVAKEAGVR
eukprot:1322085-Amorphochlora_amoeboformis.AAC.1